MVMEEQQLDMELDSERIPVPRVQGVAQVADVETLNKTLSSSRIKPRLRKKALNAAILKQMEFYFGDANLRKDRFLASLIKEDPYVDLDVFIKFNKIRELTTDVNRIAKALQASTMLQVSEDGTKVHRVTSIGEKEDSNDCTIYVQNLPSDANHDWLISTFSQYGSIAYVSVPRYKSNKKIKGFAFVEFDLVESAKKCLKAFRKRGCVLPVHTSPDDLLSITTFDDADKDVTRFASSCDDRRDSDDNKNVMTKVTEERQDFKKEECENPKKRKHETEKVDELPNVSDLLDTDSPKCKRKKECEQYENMENDDIVCDTNGQSEKTENLSVPDKNTEDESAEIPAKHKCTNSQSASEEIVDTEINVENADETSRTKEKKKSRKRKRKSKIEDVNYYTGLQIMAKNDWKRLRNKYLKLQRDKMKELKQHLQKTRCNRCPNYEKSKPVKDEMEEKESENIKKSTTTFTPGLIVKIEMDEACRDRRGFASELRSNASVKYVDISEGSYEAFVRCDTAESAQSLIQESNEKRRMTILKDEEERMYWEKIFKCKDELMNKKLKGRQRGRDKLLKKAEKILGKHIKFDEVH